MYQEIAWGMVWERVIAIFRFPFDQPEYIPAVIPIFVGLIVMETYFGRYKYEDLGWNSAVSNSALLLTTGLTLIYRLELAPHPTSHRAVVAYSILALGSIIMLLNFYHSWPEEIAFNISSSFLTYTGAYIAIATVYSGLPATRPTTVAIAVVILAFYLFFTLLKKAEEPVMPTSHRSQLQEQ